MTYTRDDLIYLAGLFDGEGCVAAYERKDGQFGSHISIGNIDGRIMNWLEDHFGGKVYANKRIKQGGTRIFYSWQIKVRDSRKLLSELIPFLILKKEQIEYLVEYIDLVGPIGAGNKHRVTNRDERLELIADMRDEKYKEYPYIKGV